MMTALPNATETMAERAWRYGLNTQPCRRLFPTRLFTAWVYLDNSAVLARPFGGPPYCVLHSLDLLPFVESDQ